MIINIKEGTYTDMNRKGGGSRKISLVRCGANNCLKDKHHELNSISFHLLDLSQTKYQVMTEVVLMLL